MSVEAGIPIGEWPALHALDIRAALPRMDQNRLRAALRATGAPAEIVRYVHSLYFRTVGIYMTEYGSQPIFLPATGVPGERVALCSSFPPSLALRVLAPRS